MERDGEMHPDELGAELAGLEELTADVLGDEDPAQDDVELELRDSITSPHTGRVLQLEFTPCGVRRCKRCFEGPKDNRVRRDPPEGHGPYYRIYKRAPGGGPVRGHHVRRKEEGDLAAEFGPDYDRLRVKRWAQWTQRQ